MPDLWLDIPSPVKEWNDKRDTDFREITESTINFWRMRCESPTTNIGEHALRNKNLNVLGNWQQTLVAGKNNARDSKEFDDFSRNLEV